MTLTRSKHVAHVKSTTKINKMCLTDVILEDKPCIYILLHESEFSAVSRLITLVYARVCLHDPAILNFFVFCEVLLKFRKCYHPHDEFDEKR